jgi:2-keto-4-pentenoate hydratase/2-oxohepta-3-ene-1,7-dioic acid hydratase in catechol pathway
MRLCSIQADAGEDVGIATDVGTVLLSSIASVTGAAFGPGLLDVITSGQLAGIGAALLDPAVRSTAVLTGAPRFAPIYYNPPKLWGVGLNFTRHADDLGVSQPTEMPGSYLRPNSTIIGDGDAIRLPPQSQRVTAEAELGVIVGTTCRDLSPDDAGSVIFGYTAVLDMTAEDAIRINPRYIPWAKAFDTFCSLGPWVVTPDEIPELAAVRISTIVNGRTHATNTVSAMMRSPHWLISYFSAGMTLEAGAVVATGTPGACVIRDGDHVEASVEGISHLHNHVEQAAEGQQRDRLAPHPFPITRTNQ